MHCNNASDRNWYPQTCALYHANSPQHVLISHNLFRNHVKSRNLLLHYATSPMVTHCVMHKINIVSCTLSTSHATNSETTQPRKVMQPLLLPRILPLHYATFPIVTQPHTMQTIFNNLTTPISSRSTFSTTSA